MKKILILLLLLISINGYSQCVGAQSSTITPPGPYQPGDVVTVSYTLSSFTQINVNWIHAFQINLGNGWTNLTAISGPANPSGSTGNWILDNQNTFTS